MAKPSAEPATPRKPGRPKAPPGPDNGRTRIVRSAARLFREKGFRAATVRELAEAAGMQSGSLFYFFRNKEEILVAVMEEGMADVHAAVAAAQAGGGPVAAFRLMAQRHLEGILDRDADHMTVMLYETRALPSAAERHVRQLRRDYEGMWEAQIDALIAVGCWRGAESPRLSRMALMGAMNWAVQWFRPDRGDTIDALVDTLAQLFLKESE